MVLSDGGDDLKELICESEPASIPLRYVDESLRFASNHEIANISVNFNQNVKLLVSFLSLSTMPTLQLISFPILMSCFFQNMPFLGEGKSVHYDPIPSPKI